MKYKKIQALNLIKVLLFKKATIIILLFLSLASIFFLVVATQRQSQVTDSGYILPLVMKGGNPYIRALMRTISASESQDSNPYTLLYGGQHFSNFSRHPNQCVTIISGPHTGECSTAAGRYQLLTSTWQEKVHQYHHKQFHIGLNYHSFEPEIQDEVVYAWLKDHHVWRVDITNLLEQGKLEQVLQLLSGTWTSLGYGTENNSITPSLSQIYQKVLAEELAQANSSSPNESYR